MTNKEFMTRLIDRIDTARLQRDKAVRQRDEAIKERDHARNLACRLEEELHHVRRPTFADDELPEMPGWQEDQHAT